MASVSLKSWAVAVEWYILLFAVYYLKKEHFHSELMNKQGKVVPVLN
jgi:hypothetical protein